MEQTERDPEKYPTVTIDGQTYPLKFTLEDLDAMEEETGIDFGDPSQLTAPSKQKRKRSLTLLSYVLRPHGVTLTPEELNKKIEVKDFPKIAEALGEMMGVKKTQVVVPAPTEKPSEVIQ